MKKNVALLLVLMMVFAVNMGSAAEKFDQSAFEKLPGNKYDKFEDSWEVVDSVVFDNGEYKSVLLSICGILTDDGYIYLMFAMVDTDDEGGRPEKIIFLIDDKRITLELVELEGYAAGGYIFTKEDKESLKTLCEAQNISMRIYTTELGTMDYEIEREQLASLLNLIQVVLDSGFINILE